MIQALHSAAAGMLAQQQALDVTANNLANINTAGFKKSRPEFTDLIYAEHQVPGGPALAVGRGVRLAGVRREMAQGFLEATGEALHVAIHGEGLFIVNLPGDVAGYTRAGTLGLDAERRLTINGGYLLEPGITVPEDATELTVTAGGTVLAAVPGEAEPVELGSIQLISFPNPHGLVALGSGMFVAGPTAGDSVQGLPGAAGLGELAQGYLERSNVDVVTEMTRMISALRVYEMNAKAVMSADEALSVANQILRR